jgi:cobalt/nickel transport system permease protein
VKVIFTLAFIIFLNLTPFNAWPGYILFLTLILTIALFSGLSLQFVLKRSLLAVPFILAAIPLVFTLPPLTQVTVFEGFQVPFSLTGFGRFASIGIRSWISIQAAIILTATTRFPDLMAALRQLKLPKLFVAIISLMWRYLFVIGEEVSLMMRARAGRCSYLPGLRAGGTVAWRARVTGGMAGSLMLRSLERSDRVYAAMLSRGYNGDLPDQPVHRLANAELLILCAGLLLLTSLWVVSGLIL